MKVLVTISCLLGMFVLSPIVGIGAYNVLYASSFAPNVAHYVAIIVSIATSAFVISAHAKLWKVVS